MRMKQGKKIRMSTVTMAWLQDPLPGGAVAVGDSCGILNKHNSVFIPWPTKHSGLVDLLQRNFPSLISVFLMLPSL